MFFTYGLVMMDRLSITYLFPFIAPTLKLNEAQIGMSVSILSICWAISSWLFSSWSDLINAKKRFLVIAILIFSLASFSTGLATTFGLLLFARGLMGAAEGPVVTIAQTSVVAESTPHRMGFNIGFVQSSTALLGTVVAPLLVVAIAQHAGWHNAFYILTIPGLIVAFILMKFMREPKLIHQSETEAHVRPNPGDYKVVFKHRNVWLCMVISIGFMSWLFAFTTFAPTFLTSIDKFSPSQASLIMSAMGLGSFVWGLIGPYLSDRIGRKPVIISFGLAATIPPILIALLHVNVGTFMILALLSALAQGYAPIFLSVIPGESVPRAFVATAMSLIILVGELCGGTIVPTVAGALADAVSPTAPLWMAAAGSFLVFLVSFGLKETAPVILKRRGIAVEMETVRVIHQ
ncbi:major facilitator superfamily MFS_1 [Alicyclobacillus acidocaldarius subsp. acidocaldarius Tc-4-1]|uniref:Major facilitator superfamily MFS_1 n=2 Tax=Alicyclobacillus acidocaldarius TaxID=405212 RepID=F8ICT3_ALIAT|nr:major facilitator superfamily MFS_1 [Alicyclobacillus acidocaldarius subsp. acidocaldarius Tc-4-1]